MSLEVVLTAGVERDLERIEDYPTRNAGPKVTAATLDKLEQRCADLAEFPNRGNVPPELSALGIRDYRELHELHERPYRIVYRVLGSQVVIYLVADARRDFRSLLEQRVLG